MKRILFGLLMCLVLVSASFGLYITSNTANTSWNSTVVITSSQSGYVDTTGCSTFILTSGDSSTGTFTAEAWWYIPGTATLVSSESISLNATHQVRAPRAKFVVFNGSGAPNVTVEAIVYCY
jgi:hypothetical protein